MAVVVKMSFDGERLPHSTFSVTSIQYWTSMRRIRLFFAIGCILATCHGCGPKPAANSQTDGDQPLKQPDPQGEWSTVYAGKTRVFGHEMRSTEGVPAHYHYLFQGRIAYEEVKGTWAKLPYSQIEFERTPCFGSCPSYVVTLNAEGAAQYNGREFAPRAGAHVGEIGVFEYGRICWAIDRFKLLEGPLEYSANWTDSSTTLIRVKRRDTGKTVEISDYGAQGPIELWCLFEAIDAASDQIKWKTVKN